MTKNNGGLVLKNIKKGTCPPLLLAPMEGVGSVAYRKAIATIGGFDIAYTPFFRIPINAHVKSLVKQYDRNEISPYTLVPQLMGADEKLLSQAVEELNKKSAPQIDLNCGCPSNVVVRRKAGANLLKTPSIIYNIVKHMVASSDVPISVKMRSGFSDTSQYLDILHAVEDAGASIVCIHPRIRDEGYSGTANWEMISIAKSILKIKVIGNGDVVTKADAINMLTQTKCDAIMIGRGALYNPWIFWDIRQHFTSQPTKKPLWQDFIKFIDTYCLFIKKDRENVKINKLKQLFKLLMHGYMEEQKIMLQKQYVSSTEILNTAIPIVKCIWKKFCFE
jgi:nifR3 family TIM-barrel protein